MGKNKQLIIIIPFFFILIFFCRESFLLGEIKVSGEESRELKSWNEINLKNIRESTGEIEEYLVDQFPHREDFLALFSKKDKFLNKRFSRDIYISEDDWLFTESSREDMTKLGLEVDKLTKAYPNKEIYYGIIPTKNVALKEKYSFTKNTVSRENYQELRSSLEKIGTSNFTIIDLIPLAGNEDFLNDEAKWYRTDFHWNALGGKVATDYILESMVEAGGIERIYKEDNIEKKILKDKVYLGDINKRFSYIYGRDKPPIYLDLVDKSGYSYFVREDNAYPTSRERIIASGIGEEYLNYGKLYTENLAYYRVVNERAANNKSILIIKDSMQNASIDLFTESFRETRVIDPRLKQSYSLKELMDSVDIVLFYLHQNNKSETTVEYLKSNLT